MDPTLYDIVLHAGIPLASSAVAGAGAYYGVKFAIKDHAQRLDLIVQRQMWVIHKLIVLGTHHNTSHPDKTVNVEDFPVDRGGAFKI